MDHDRLRHAEIKQPVKNKTESILTASLAPKAAEKFSNSAICIEGKGPFGPWLQPLRTLIAYPLLRMQTANENVAINGFPAKFKRQLMCRW